MIGMLGVADGRDEMLVAGDTAAVLWRPGTLGGQAHHRQVIRRGVDGFDDDVVHPVVTEVVGVPQPATLARRQLGERRVPLVDIAGQVPDRDVMITASPRSGHGGVNSSGKVEPGETLEATLVRELEKETSLDVRRISHYLVSFVYTSGSG